MDIHTLDPQQVHLPINVGTELLVEFVNLNLRVKTTLVGFESGGYLIIRISSQDLVNCRSDIIRDCNLIVRYLYRGSVYGFKTSILNMVSNPARLLFLSYPTRIEGYNVRSNPRYECILPAAIKMGETSAEMVIVDISRDGCRCVVKTSAVADPEELYKFIDVNKGVQVLLQLPGIEDRIDLSGDIRNLNKDSDRIVFGLMFDSLRQDVKARLEGFISLISEISKPE